MAGRGGGGGRAAAPPRGRDARPGLGRALGGRGQGHVGGGDRRVGGGAGAGGDDGVDGPPVVAVPSGNFGNLCAGMLTQASGLPIGHFIAACNANDPVPGYFRTGGQYAAQTAVPTISNAMDVGNPSNFVRILELFGHDFSRLQQTLSADTVSDADTKATIAQVWQEHNYLLDPHGAVAYTALRRYLDQHPGQQGFFLATAHPVKFPDVVEEITGQPVPLPEAVRHLQGRTKQAVPLPPDYAALRDFLWQHGR